MRISNNDFIFTSHQIGTSFAPSSFATSSTPACCLYHVQHQYTPRSKPIQARRVMLPPIATHLEVHLSGMARITDLPNEVLTIILRHLLNSCGPPTPINQVRMIIYTCRLWRVLLLTTKFRTRCREICYITNVKMGRFSWYPCLRWNASALKEPAAKKTSEARAMIVAERKQQFEIQKERVQRNNF